MTKAVLATLDFAKPRLGVLQQGQDGQHQASYAMGRPEPTFSAPMSTTGACRRLSRVLVDGTMILRGLLSMTSVDPAPLPHSPPNS